MFFLFRAGMSTAAGRAGLRQQRIKLEVAQKECGWDDGELAACGADP
jgi:hypothetical protein